MTTTSQTQRRTRHAGVLLTLAAFVAGAIVTAGWGAAAATPKPVALAACADAKGVLRLETAKGTCAKGSHKVVVGSRGPKGTAGPKGATGRAGAVGAAGSNGRTVLSGTGAPGALTPAKTGDFYLDTSTHLLYGPAIRTCGLLCSTRWGTPVSLIGPVGQQGAPGAAGAPGSQDLSVASTSTGDVVLTADPGSTLLYLPVRGGHTYLFQVSGDANMFGAFGEADCSIQYVTSKETRVLTPNQGAADLSGMILTEPISLTATLTAGLDGNARFVCYSNDFNVKLAATMTALEMPSH